MKTMELSIQKKGIRLLASTALLTMILILHSSFLPTNKLTDPEIASIAVTSNQIDVDMGKIAKEKSKNADVLKFAQEMIQDHQSVIDQAVALVKKLKVTPKDNAMSKKLNADAEVTKKMLLAKSTKEFNKAYVDHEVTYHKAVINTVQKELIPQTQNKELKALLEKVLPILKSHLAHAEMIQKMFTK